MTRRGLVIGASGDVGGGILRALKQRGWEMVAAGRSVERLRDALDADDRAVAVDLTTAGSAAGIRDDLALDSFDVVVVSVSVRSQPVALEELTVEELLDRFHQNLLPHLNAAREIVPRMREGAVYLAIGGGIADFAVPGMAAESMIQAAERALIRSVAKEYRSAGVHIRLATIAAPVAGHGAELLHGLDAVPTDVIGSLVADSIENAGEKNNTVITITDPRRS